MPAASTSSFRVYAAAGGLQMARAAMHEVWWAIGNVFPDASKFDLRGVGLLIAEPCVLELRFAADFDTGFLACEGLDRNSGERWELFVIASPHGVVTTGWRGDGAFGMEPPDVWVAGAMLLDLPPTPPVIAAPLGHPLLGENSINEAVASSISLAMVADAARQSVRRVLEVPVTASAVEEGA